MAEEINIAPKGKDKKSAAAGPIVEAEESGSESEEEEGDAPDGADKAARKKQMK